MSHQALDPNSLVPLSELAELFHRSPRTITRWAREGVLPTVKVGGSTYVPRNELEALIANVRAESSGTHA